MKKSISEKPTGKAKIAETNTSIPITQPGKCVNLINSDGKIKNCKVGFSWTSLLFLYFVPLVRLDFKNFIIQLFVLSIASITSEYVLFILWIFFAITYNKQYIKGLIKKGYKAVDEYSINLLIKNGLVFEKDLETTDFISNEEIVNDVVEDSNLNIKHDLIEISSFSNFNDSYLDFDDEEEDDDNLDLDDFGISINMSYNGRPIINNDIKVNDIEPEGYHKFLTYENVVGVTFENREILVNKFINGTDRKVTLVKDPLNPYDPNAIKVMGSCLYKGKLEEGQLGFLSKDTARKLSNFEYIKSTVNAVAGSNKIRLDIWISSKEYQSIKVLEDTYKDILRNENKVYKYIEIAESHEKNNDIEKAIEYYEKAIELNCDGNYPYNRLAILYRKNKDYDNEIRVLNKGIEVFEILGKVTPRSDIYPKLDKFKERLSKAETLKFKNINKLVKKEKNINDVKKIKTTTHKVKKVDINSLNYDRIVSLDFETANNSRASVCSIGYIVEENGEIIKEDEVIVNPKTEFSNINVKIHRIKDVDVQDAPTWDVIWKQVEEYITDSTLIIAHNLKSMELSCIRQECERYNMDLPEFLSNKNNPLICDTLQLSKKCLPDMDNYKLNTLCEYFNIELEHHNALSDAKACLDLFHHLRGDYSTNE